MGLASEGLAVPWSHGAPSGDEFGQHPHSLSAGVQRAGEGRCSHTWLRAGGGAERAMQTEVPSSSRVQSPEAPPTCSCATQGRGQAWPGATLPVSPGFPRASGSPQETVCVDVCRYRHTHTRTCAHTVLDTCTHRPRIPVKSPGLDSWEEGIVQQGHELCASGPEDRTGEGFWGGQRVPP